MAFRKIRETITAIRGTTETPTPVVTVQEFWPAGALRTMGSGGYGSTENKTTIELTAPSDNVTIITEPAERA